jgi:hypothetical protein
LLTSLSASQACPAAGCLVGADQVLVQRPPSAC